MSVFFDHIRAGFPCLWMQTSEPTRAMGEYTTESKKMGFKCFAWDFNQGVKEIGNGFASTTEAGDAVGAIKFLRSQPSKSILFLLNFHKFIGEVDVFQEIANQADLYKGSGKCLVVVSPLADIPTEIEKLFSLIRYDLPDKKTLLTVLRYMAESSSKPLPDDAGTDKILESAKGLTAWEFENALALSVITKKAFEPDVILEQKKQLVRKNASLILEDSDETLENLGGMAILKEFCLKVANSPLSKGVLLLGVPGTGKCLAEGTLVLKYDGQIVPVEQIKNGDFLMGPDSNPRKVYGITSGFGKLYRVTPKKGESYTVNEHHVLSLKKSGSEKTKNISIEEYLSMGKRDFQGRWKGWRTGVDWTQSPVPIPAYILGLYLGDGHNQSAALTTMDQEIYDEFTRYIESKNLLIQTKSNGSKALTYRVVGKTGKGKWKCGNSFLEELQKLKILGNKHIPRIYLINGRMERLELLAGLIDTDGALSCGGYEITTKFPRLKDDILFLSRSLGFAAYSASRFIKLPSMKQPKEYFRIFISGNCNEIPVRIPHKKATSRKQIKDVLKSSLRIESAGNGIFYGFELDGDRLFLLGDFTVTHNSHFSKGLGKALGIPTAAMDFGRMFGSLVGESEERIRGALDVVDSFSPCVLRIDEIEKGLSGIQSSGQTDGGTGSRVFGTFLNWLNDRTSRVFVIATCNDISKMPPEFLRAERWDAIFFVDLPNKAERDIIFNLYQKLYKAKGTPPTMDGWSGAEIKSLCRIAAMLGTTLEDSSRFIMPLSQSLGDKIEDLRQWAKTRTISASKPDPEEMAISKGLRRINA